MKKNRIIVIGASAGGFDAIQTLVSALPPALPASIFIVWHMSADVRGILPHVLNKYDTLPAANATDNEQIAQGRIYVAPPDRHMLIENGRIRITRGPKENRFRPAVDPLFRSAAFTYGQQVIGIILTGGLDDGTAGLWSVKFHGGIAIVQDPEDAAVPSMPEHAIRGVKVDYTCPVQAMPALLTALCHTEAETIHATQENEVMEKNTQLATEIDIARGEKGLQDIMQEPSPYACPECHGVLFTIRDGTQKRFRCHTGHAYSSDSLLLSITEAVDDSLWNVIRGIEESMILLNQVGDHHADLNNPRLASKYFTKAQQAETRLAILKDMVMTSEVLSDQSIRDEMDELEITGPAG